jgi:hypothetical protein
MKFTAPEDFDADTRLALREMLINAECGVRNAEDKKTSLPETDAYRLVHGAADGWPGWQVDRLGEFLLSQAGEPLSPPQEQRLHRLMENYRARGAYHKILRRQVRRRSVPQASPQFISGQPAPGAFYIRENGAQFELSFNEGYSTGLFAGEPCGGGFSRVSKRRGSGERFECIRVHLRVFSLRGEGRRANDEPGFVQKISGLGKTQFRAQRA